MLTGDCNVCINGKMPSYSATCVKCGLSRKNYKPITKADRIRSMTDEELAELMREITDPLCPPNHGYKYCRDGEFRKCWLDWLKEEAAE
jgi:hypothetical protein